MTRTTTAATPAPRNRKSGAVKTYKVQPEALETADLSAPDLSEEIGEALISDALSVPTEAPAMPLDAIGRSFIGADIAAMLANAEEEEAAERRRAKREPIARVNVTAAHAAALAAAGWKAPRLETRNVITPEKTTRRNACKGAAAYRVAAALLESGPMHVADLAALWLASGNSPRPLASIAQQISNRTGKTITQFEEMLRMS